MTSQYTVEEIDKMRWIIFDIIDGPYLCGLKDGYVTAMQRVEDQLRTYMQNGTTPEELFGYLHEKRAKEIKKDTGVTSDSFERGRGSAPDWRE